MEVLTRQKCSDCVEGWVDHPVIVAFNLANQEHFDYHGYYMGEMKEAQWFAKNGFKTRPRVEQKKCETCKATGYVQLWIDIDLDKLKKVLEK